MKWNWDGRRIKRELKWPSHWNWAEMTTAVKWKWNAHSVDYWHLLCKIRVAILSFIWKRATLSPQYIVLSQVVLWYAYYLRGWYYHFCWIIYFHLQTIQFVNLKNTSPVCDFPLFQVSYPMVTGKLQSRVRCFASCCNNTHVEVGTHLEMRTMSERETVIEIAALFKEHGTAFG